MISASIVAAAPLQPLGELDEFVRLAADLGVHREAAGRAAPPACPWRRSSPSRRRRRSAAARLAGAAAVRVRAAPLASARPSTCRRSSGRSTRGGHARRLRGGRVAAVETMPLQPTSGDDRRAPPTSSAGRADAQPVVGQRRQLAPCRGRAARRSGRRARRARARRAAAAGSGPRAAARRRCPGRVSASTGQCQR